MRKELERAKALVAAAEAYLEDQRQILASLAALRRDTSSAEHLLHTMEAALNAFRDHQRWVERKLTASGSRQAERPPSDDSPLKSRSRASS